MGLCVLPFVSYTSVERREGVLKNLKHGFCPEGKDKGLKMADE